jgi:large subunit ribosomal protein L9
MKVILKQDVPNLGEEGDILVVAPGYARNYLFPRQLAGQYNTTNLALLEARKAHIEKAKESKRKLAESDREKIQTTPVILSFPAGENGKLFGSVSNIAIAEELSRLGVHIERKKIEVPGHIIKSVGDYKIRVKLYGGEDAELKLTVKAQEDPKAHARNASKPVKSVEAVVAPTPAEENVGSE